MCVLSILLLLLCFLAPCSIGVMVKVSGMKALPDGGSDRGDTLARLHFQRTVGT